MKQATRFLAYEHLQQLIHAIIDHGYSCIGPQMRDGTIIYDSLTSVEELPLGINIEQSPGHYSVSHTGSTHYFDWANGPQAIKPLLFAPREKLWQSTKSVSGEISFSVTPPSEAPVAIFAARACDIAAMKLQDQHFLQQRFIDPYYQSRRDNLLLIAVNCSHPSSTCFCHSTGDGPFAEDGFDIALTELDDGFLITAETTIGEKILQSLPLQNSTQEQLDQSAAILHTAQQQQRALPEADIPQQLFRQLNNTAWQEIAETCLSCGNCTAVCPTCFCHSEHDQAELDGTHSSHYREWDSCFTQGHSYIHGITIRADTSQRYRQWLTHKFGSWVEQYGRSGCVGCGRCISWCPVGIDVVESVTSIVESKHE